MTYLDRAITYSAMGRYDLAIKDYRRSSRLNPYSEILLRNIAFTYLNAHQFDSSIYYYSKVIILKRLIIFSLSSHQATHVAIYLWIFSF